MDDKILKSIMVHLSYLDQLNILNQKLRKSLLNDQIESLHNISLNRERLIKLIQSYEVKINKYFSENKIKTVKNLEVFNEWKVENSKFIEITKKETFFLIEALTKTKEKTKNELSKIFKMNQSHNAYLTHSLKL